MRAWIMAYVLAWLSVLEGLNIAVAPGGTGALGFSFLLAGVAITVVAAWALQASTRGPLNARVDRLLKAAFGLAAYGALGGGAFAAMGAAGLADQNLAFVLGAQLLAALGVATQGGILQVWMDGRVPAADRRREALPEPVKGTNEALSTPRRRRTSG